MEQFFQFIIHHWILWSALLLVIVIIILEAIKDKMQGLESLSTQALTQLINHENAAVIDARDSNAFAKGHIIGSINLPNLKVEADIEKLKAYVARPIIIVYANAQTSTKEAAKLKSHGFEKVYCLSGGIAAWSQAGLPLTRK